MSRAALPGRLKKRTHQESFANLLLAYQHEHRLLILALLLDSISIEEFTRLANELRDNVIALKRRKLD